MTNAVNPEWSSFEDIEQIHKELTENFDSTFIPSDTPSPDTSNTSPNTNGNNSSHSPFPLRSLPFRIHQLHQLARLVQENADAFCEALSLDQGKPRKEVLMAEVGPIIERSLGSARGVAKWSRDHFVAKQGEVHEGRVVGEEGLPAWQASWGARIESRAKGVVLIISPWNYPLILSFQPLYGAISAGCPAVLKPSEMVPNFSALIKRLVSEYLDPRAYRVVTGGVVEIGKVLEKKWAHIFYTGNGRVGRIISAAAARHLTPLTLELGGKSPVIVDPTTLGKDGGPAEEADLEAVAKRIIWGKINNSGQICVAPDYVLIPSPHIPAFTKAISKALASFFPEGSELQPDGYYTNGASISEDYGRIVTPLHFGRIKKLVEGTKGTVVVGGVVGVGDDADLSLAKNRYIAPTVVTFPTIAAAALDVLLEEELFAPILPVVGVESVREAVGFVRGRDHPLVLYAFTNDEKLKKIISDSTMSGGLVFNDTFQQLSVDQTPFGGVGESGYGRQTMKYTFDEFVYQRSVVDIPSSAEPILGLRYPPTSKASLEFFSNSLKTPIPSVDDVKAGLFDAPVTADTAGIPIKQTQVAPPESPRVPAKGPGGIFGSLAALFGKGKTVT